MYTVDVFSSKIVDTCSFRFDPTKFFRAAENPISTPYSSQQPMPTHKKQDGEDPAH